MIFNLEESEQTESDDRYKEDREHVWKYLLKDWIQFIKDMSMRK